MNTAVEATRTERAWAVLDAVPDPEVPAISVRELGIVREVLDHGASLEVVLTPTYSGCPATEVIERSVIDAIDAAGLGPARVTMRRAPAWTTDWISEQGKRKLHDYGIAPPAPGGDRTALFGTMTVPCPRCGSTDTTQLAAFGSTACKALWRCTTCREPFDYFKCH